MALHWFALIMSPDCGYPKFIAFFMLPQNFFIFILFYDFYRKAYSRKSEVTVSVKRTESNNNVVVEDESILNDDLKKKVNGNVGDQNTLINQKID